jgi:hypothetical protein
MRDTGCIADIDSEMKTLLEAKKCTIDYFSPTTAHHMLTLELGKKNGIPVSILHSLSSKGHTPPYYTKTSTGILLHSRYKTHYSANMIMSNDYLNEKTYKVNPSYPYQEIFREEQGRVGTILSLMGSETVYRVPNIKLMEYEPNVINCDFKKYCIKNGIEADDNLIRTFNNTIHNPRIVSI